MKTTTATPATAIRTRLSEISIGMTTAIFGKVVTRWSADTFEIGTWGRTSISLADAVAKVNS